MSQTGAARRTSFHSRLETALKGRSIYLLISLLALLLLYPSALHGPYATVFILLLHTITLVAGVYAVSDTRGHIVTALCIAVPQVVLALIGYSIPASHPADTPLHVLESGLLVVFYVFAIRRVLAYALEGHNVTGDRIAAVLSGYLMLGLAWAFLYSLVNRLAPGSFSLADRAEGTGLELIYFSFATITTLGYGDITPITPRTRSLALLEAVTGVLYIAVLVSSLIGAYQGERKTDD